MKYIYYSIIAILFIALAWVYFTKPEPYHETTIVHDTTTITRYEQAVKRDTVIKWYERVVTHQSKPEVIYQQKIDTVFREKIKKYDLILGLDKQGTKLRVFAVNEYGMLLKEQLFENVYSNFTAYSAENAIIVKSSLWRFSPLSVSYQQVRPINNLKEFNHSVGLQSELNFIDRYTLGLGVNYDLNKKDVSLKGEIKIKIY